MMYSAAGFIRAAFWFGAMTGGKSSPAEVLLHVGAGHAERGIAVCAWKRGEPKVMPSQCSQTNEVLVEKFVDTNAFQ